ncbi:MAG: pyruvate formate-lyase-activating protein [Oscillospiraceae bacterium]
MKNFSFKNKITAPVHSFESMGATDGPGVRAVVFLQGCPLKCVYCHNPDATFFNETPQNTPQEIFEKIIKLKPFIKNGGVTISGGEPLLYPEFCKELINLCNMENIHTAIDTSGICAEKAHFDVIKTANLILLDIKSSNDEMCEKITGQSNKNAINVLNFCNEIKKDVWIRHVVVPELTFNENDIKDLAFLLKNYNCIKKIELLPFHQLGKHKWENLNLEYKLNNVKPLSNQQLKQAYNWFEEEFLKNNVLFNQKTIKNVLN